MIKQKRYVLGFTLVELSVVMIVFSVITAVLIAFYMEAQQHLSRGIAQTTLQQKTRNAAVRIIPKIASAIYRPETTIIKNGSPVTLPALKAITKPAVSINDSNPPDTDSDSPIPSTYSREICLTSVRPFIEDQLARSSAEMTQAEAIRDSFDPRNIN